MEIQKISISINSWKILNDLDENINNNKLSLNSDKNEFSDNESIENNESEMSNNSDESNFLDEESFGINDEMKNNLIFKYQSFFYQFLIYY